MATNTDKIINPFKEQDIDFVDLPKENTRYGSEVLGNLKELQIGSGQYGFYSDESGIWLGAKKFASAPFSVDMFGNLKATVGTFSGDIDGATITGSTISGNTITGGSISGTSITGSTLSTANSGQRVVLTTTLANFYDSSGANVASTYAESGAYYISSSGSIYLVGSSGGNVNVTFGSGVDYVMNANIFYTAVGADLGSGVARWGDFYGNDINCGNILAGGLDIPYGGISLGGDTIYNWSDITPDLSAYAKLSGATFSGNVSVGSNTFRVGGYLYLNSSGSNAYVYSTGSSVQIASGGSVALDTSSYLKLNGTQVVSTRKNAVSSPSADVASLKTAVDAIINRLSSHGLISS